MSGNSPINNQRIGAQGGSGASRYQNSNFAGDGEIVNARDRLSQLRSSLNRSDGLAGSESRAGFQQSTQDQINYYAAIANGSLSDAFVDPSSINLDQDSSLRGLIDPRDLITREDRSEDAFDTPESKVVEARNTQKRKDDPLNKYFKHLSETLFKDDNADSFFGKYKYSNQNTNRGNVVREEDNAAPADPSIRRSHRTSRY